jgi:peptidoglycan/LPS O-acetylase OafA/YrhL
MPEYKDQNVVAAHHAVNRKKAQLWAITFLAAIVCAAAVFYFIYEQPGPQTTSDGRKIESPSTATGGSAR